MEIRKITFEIPIPGLEQFILWAAEHHITVEEGAEPVPGTSLCQACGNPWPCPVIQLMALSSAREALLNEASIAAFDLTEAFIHRAHEVHHGRKHTGSCDTCVEDDCKTDHERIARVARIFGATGENAPGSVQARATTKKPRSAPQHRYGEDRRN